MALTTEQLAIRSKGVGASEVAALVGLDPHRGPIDVWRKKVEQHQTEQTGHTKRGRYFERAILEWYSDETGLAVKPGASSAHRDHPLVIATPDAIASDSAGARRVVEIKSPSWRTAREWHEDGIPDRYVCQMQQQMFVEGLPLGDNAAYVDEQLLIQTIEYDPEIAASLVDAIEKFWRNHVLTGRPPDPDGSTSYSEWLKERFAKTAGVVLHATPEIEEWAARLRDAKAQVEVAESAEREARNHIQAFIGDADGVHGAFGKLSWKHNKPSSKVDWEAVARELGATPQQIAKHTQERPGPRVFRATWAKE